MFAPPACRAAVMAVVALLAAPAARADIVVEDLGVILSAGPFKPVDTFTFGTPVGPTDVPSSVTVAVLPNVTFPAFVPPFPHPTVGPLDLSGPARIGRMTLTNGLTLPCGPASFLLTLRGRITDPAVADPAVAADDIEYLTNPGTGTDAWEFLFFDERKRNTSGFIRVFVPEGETVELDVFARLRRDPDFRGQGYAFELTALTPVAPVPAPPGIALVAAAVGGLLVVARRRPAG